MKKTTKKPRKNFGMMQREMLKHVKGNDLTVFIALLSYTDDYATCYPSVQTLADETGISARNVQKHLANLEEAGWIDRNYRTNTSTLYQLYFIDTSKAPKKKAKGASKSDVSPPSKIDMSGASKSDVSGVSKSDVLTDQLTNHNNKPNNSVVSAVTSNSDSSEEKYVLSIEQKAEFEELWKKNKQEGEAKVSALSAWRRYYSYEDDKLMRYIKNFLDKTTGTYMTSQMKEAYEILTADRLNKQLKAEKKAKGDWREL